MLSQSQLCKLSARELLLIQKHVHLGKEHLAHLLTKQEFQHILQLGDVASREEDRLFTDKAEIAGHATMVINTMMTSTLGAWMGFSGFWDFDLIPLFYLDLYFRLPF